MAEVFSLHATKVFGIGEGGVVYCHPQLGRIIKETINFGMSRGVIVCRGLNGKMSDFQAAVGLAALPRIDGWVRHRLAIVQMYRDAFAAGPWALPGPHCGSPPWQTLPMLLPRGWQAERVVEACQAQGVELRRYYAPALPDAAPIRGTEAHDCHVARRLAQDMICLPVYSDMTVAEAHGVIAVVQRALRSAGSDRRARAA
jgi:dTDP-4-amino-4,6-dideoxygalactose transaminase